MPALAFCGRACYYFNDNEKQYIRHYNEQKEKPSGGKDLRDETGF